jgi:leucyl-tRNA synthetase
VKYWFPVDQYIGGIEHAILHLIYMRFFTKVMQDIGLVDFSEPVARLFNQGMVLRESTKMSKSRGNVVAPTEMFAKYGADTVRVYMLFAAPPEKDFNWSDLAIEGAARFLAKVYRLVAAHAAGMAGVSTAHVVPAGNGGGLSAEERHLLRKSHQTLHHVTEDMEDRWHFNTSVALCMELTNEIGDLESAFEAGKIRPHVFKAAIEHLVVMLSLFAPHIADELWEALGHSEPVLRVPWPKCDPELAKEEELEIPVQINGKLRSRIRVAAGTAEAEIRARALADEKVVQHLNGKQVVKVIVVPDKLVSIVVK